MALVLEIVLGLMIVAALIVAFMGARTWPIYQVVLAVFVFLGAVAFFYLGARTLATHNAWRTQVRQRESEVVELEKKQQMLLDGGPPGPEGQPDLGIGELKRQLESIGAERGRVLRDVTVDGVNNGVVQLTFKTAPALPANTVLFAFDQAPFGEGGRYRGEFKVVGGEEAATQIQVAPNLPLTDAAMQALAATKGPWLLYLNMPKDDPSLFTSLDEAARRALLPATSVEEFGNADRRLRDYELIFHDSYLQRSLLVDAIRKTTGTIERTEAGVKSTNEDIAYRTTEKSNLSADLDKFKQELVAVTDYEGKLESMLRKLQQDVQTTFTRNRQLAAQLTADQTQAAGVINQRTAAAAGSEPAGGTQRPNGR